VWASAAQHTRATFLAIRGGGDGWSAVRFRARPKPPVSAEGQYILLSRWSLKGEYDYVNLLDPSVSGAPGSTTIAKAGMPLNRRTLKVGGNYDF
jgi:hypothetical protein